ncbi:MBL fold metallo-hydrolase [Thalassospira sp. MCCC 1A03138]|uniref:MBL fold metallo-hydrolase n=1 Tax=Thalassospira sp. MCCC 1A03138 TaxID=1470576 RepID=UPI000A1E3F58|nr:MBL fold metallo-hydrolase [Thalassospira sp. MCCC 1A03138]OSQ30944.1 hydrolase [Thalassospira sp. MCCC 1A03138]
MTKITILGCGSSNGVPSVGLGWGKCNPTNPKNRRLRSSILIEQAGKKILVDVTPDFREQALRHDINHVDAVLFTHAHADHVHGIDELRWINVAMHRPIDIYASAATISDIDHRFAYVFEPLANGTDFYYKPVLIPHVISGPFEAAGVPITVFRQDHGYGETLGFKVGKFAYSTDVVNFPEESREHLYGLDVWVVDCLRHKPHGTHAHLEKALEWVEEFKPKQTYFTHMSILFDYDEAMADTPDHVAPAYDGLVIDLD